MFDNTTRRTFILTSSAVITAGLAGCIGDDDNENNGDADGPDQFEIDPGTTVVLDGYASHWEGVQPSDIEEVDNPTLVLEEGGEYEFEWINADGMTHDLQIWDESNNVVDDLTTDATGDEGEGFTLEFTASSEMTTYVCSFHRTNQIGDLVVE